jgi:hypothetical protein
MNDW